MYSIKFVRDEVTLGLSPVYSDKRGKIIIGETAGPETEYFLETGPGVRHPPPLTFSYIPSRNELSYSGESQRAKIFIRVIENSEGLPENLKRNILNGLEKIANPEHQEFKEADAA